MNVYRTFLINDFAVLHPKENFFLLAAYDLHTGCEEYSAIFDMAINLFIGIAEICFAVL